MKASGARHWVLLFAATLSIMTYVTRVCISQGELKGAMMADLGLTEVQMGYAFAAFAWGYALFEIPGGWFGDWLGPRRVLMRIVIWWSFFTMATGWVGGFASLLVTRFMFGAGEAGCFPSLAKVFTAWLPPTERPRAIGVMWLSARWGGALTPLLVVWVISAASWRRAFEIFGAAGLVWAFCFYSWYRDDPREHQAVNASELELLKGSEQNTRGHARVPWGKLLRSRTVWLLWIQYFCFSYGWYFYITWLPTYLEEARGVTLTRGALLSGVPLFFGGIGSMLSGSVAAWLSRHCVNVATTRRTLAYSGYLGAAGMLVLSIYIRDPFWAMISMGLASFSLDLALPGCWNTCMDVGGRFAGTLSGSMNMMGNLAGGVAPVAVAYILRFTHRNWPTTFWISAAIYVLGGLCWRWIDPVTPLEEAESASESPFASTGRGGCA
jgi:ACS family glucarate transporter-like MFS transporter